MNFALIVDRCKVQSYTIRDSKAYKLSDPTVPYQFHHSVGNECFIGFWGYPFVFNGSFINWSEYDNNLPKLDLDLIFVAIESDYEKYTIDKLRKTYPNAIIAAVLKETWNWDSWANKRIEVYNQCDYVFTCISENRYKKFMPQLLNCKVPVYFLPQPVNIDYLYNNYYNESRNEMIYLYDQGSNPVRSGSTRNFVQYISKKYNIPYVDKQDPLWANFLNLWTPCTFHFNLDPAFHFPGQQAMQCAALGIINIGGVNDSHSLLWPETATNDFDQLEYYFNLYLTDYNKRINTIQNAYNILNNVYSYTAVYNSALNILKL